MTIKFYKLLKTVLFLLLSVSLTQIASAQYCTPLYNFTGCDEGDDINTFMLTGDNGTSFNDVGTGCALGAYDDRTLQTPVQLTAGGTYSGQSNSSYSGTFGGFETIKIWIDINNDQVFDASEVVGSSSNILTTLVPFTITLPVSANAGTYRMRVRSIWQTTTDVAAITACGATTEDYTETHDYTVSVTASSACSGMPTAGTATGPTSLCPNIGFTLNSSGWTVASGISYQWESSPAGAGTWNPIAGATDPSYAVSGGITSSTDYRLVVTCVNGGSSANSNTVSVTVNSFFNCYCATHNEGTSQITNVTIVGTTLNNTSGGGSLPDYYTSYPPTGSATATLMQGQSYDLSATFDGSFPAIGSVWIDYDQDGLYSSSEWAQITTASVGTTPSTVSITVPMAALTGQTGMRVRSRNTGSANGATDACTQMFSGETEDYVITIAAASACGGAPTAGTASGPANACVGVAFNLSLTGYTIASGISIQWESSPAGLGTFTPIAGATTPNYTVVSQLTPTDYQAVVTCANGGTTATSNMLSIGQNLPTQCYCFPTYIDNGPDDIITNVSLGTLTNNTTAAGNPPTHYTDYTSQQPGTLAIPDMIQGQSYNLSLTFGNEPAQYSGVWVDFDQNGSLDAGEFFSSTPASPGANGTSVVAITVPLAAVTGNTRMRIRGGDDVAMTSSQACGASNSTYGEAEDYLVNIVATTACSAVTAGTASGPANICANTAFDLTLTGYTLASGITIQWESSPSGAGTFTPIAGATNSVYNVASQTASTDYQAVVTCSNGGATATSNIVSVTQNGPNQCYCGFTVQYDVEPITLVDFAGINNSTSATINGSPSLEDYTSITGTVSQTTSVPITVKGNTGGAWTNYIRVFVDWDQNGDFLGLDESYDIGTIANSSGTDAVSVTGNIAVPGTALLGNTRMRVTKKYSVYAPACNTNDGYGQAEDYTITVTGPPSCVQPGGLAAANVTASSADVSWTAVSGAAGYEWALDQTSGAAPGGASTINTTTSNTPPTASGLSATTTYYLHVRTDCGSGNFSAWSVYSFQTTLANDLPASGTMLTMNATCTGSPYSNVGASFSPGEPPVSCRGTSVTNGALVWFRFVAPASGFVKVTTDFAGGGLADTKLGLFGTTNPSDPNDLTAYYIIGCDDDNGVTGGTRSTVYASGLTAGETYYVGVDHYNGAGTGTFCLEVDEVTSSMIAPAGSCSATTETPYSREDYTGWVSIVDDQGRLIANTRRVTPGATNAVYNYNASLTVNNSGTVRQAGTQYYLDRNYFLSYGSTGTAFDVKFYFLTTEFDAFNLASGGTVSLSDLNVTHQTGAACIANYNSAPGINTLLTQSGSGSANGVGWVSINTPGFSNFYLMTGANPLSISLANISATNVSNRNRVDWTSVTEREGDRFEVERSIDGVNFTRIGTVTAKGGASSYSFWDNAPVTGANHYRLNLVEASGKNAYSKVVTAVVKSGVFTVLAYPNPVRSGEMLNVQVYGTSEAKASLVILDMAGKLIRSIEVSGLDVNNKIEVDLNGVAPGIYQLRYADSQHSQTIKINKQ